MGRIDDQLIGLEPWLLADGLLATIGLSASLVTRRRVCRPGGAQIGAGLGRLHGCGHVAAAGFETGAWAWGLPRERCVCGLRRVNGLAGCGLASGLWHGLHRLGRTGGGLQLLGRGSSLGRLHGRLLAWRSWLGFTIPCFCHERRSCGVRLLLSPWSSFLVKVVFFPSPRTPSDGATLLDLRTQTANGRHLLISPWTSSVMAIPSPRFLRMDSCPLAEQNPSSCGSGIVSVSLLLHAT